MKLSELRKSNKLEDRVLYLKHIKIEYEKLKNIKPPVLLDETYFIQLADTNTKKDIMGKIKDDNVKSLAEECYQNVIATNKQALKDFEETKEKNKKWLGYLLKELSEYDVYQQKTYPQN